MIKRIGEQYHYVVDGAKILVATPSDEDKEKFDLYIDTRNTMRGAGLSLAETGNLCGGLHKQQVARIRDRAVTD
jgi:hypothetical protein